MKCQKPKAFFSGTDIQASLIESENSAFYKGLKYAEKSLALIFGMKQQDLFWLGVYKSGFCFLKTKIDP